MALPILEIFSAVSPLLDKLIPDKAKADQAKIDLQKTLNEIQVKELEHDATIKQAQASIIVAEAQSESAAARNWRPHLMYLIMMILGYNYLVAPILSTLFKHFGLELQIMAIPPDMWTLLTMGVTGYIVGKSGERIIDTYSQGKVDQAKALNFNDKLFFDEYRTKFGDIKDQATVDALNAILKKYKDSVRY